MALPGPYSQGFLGAMDAFRSFAAEGMDAHGGSMLYFETDTVVEMQ